MTVILHDGKEYDLPIDAIMDALTDDDIESEADHRGLTPEPEIEYETEYVDRIDDAVAARDLLVEVSDFLRKSDKINLAQGIDILLRELDI